MIEKLEAIKQRYDILTEKIADPAVIARMDEWKKLQKNARIWKKRLTNISNIKR